MGLTHHPAPPIGWTTACQITRCIDGDTLDIETRRTLRIRLLDCWAPEKRGPEKAAGLASRDHLARLIAAAGPQAIAHIPGSARQQLAELLTFGRFVGRVWLPDHPDDLSERQIAAGFATRQKEPRP